MLELNKIYCMDCLEGMKQIDDESIDLVLTDPPYNVLGDTQEWDKFENEKEFFRLCRSWFDEFHRILCDGGTLVSFLKSWDI